MDDAPAQDSTGRANAVTPPADQRPGETNGSRASSRMLRWPRRVLRLLVLARRRFSLRDDTDVDQTVRRITEASRLDGEAPWMLVCSCLLASIGLDVNSTAVIIGAMLISPLMSPILGIGLATGQADRPLLFASARELGLATVVALATSTIYFWLSPLGVPTSELVARTTPTLLDVAVAFFGGVAGIVAGSRRRTSLALPGVAIATALMPPLCTAGFGLATGRPAFFFGALYLFVLNAIFIAIATFAVVRILRFPLHTSGAGQPRGRELRLIAGIAGVAILPSLWFLYTTVQRQRENGRIDRFVQEQIAARGHDVLRWDSDTKGDTTFLKLFIAGRPLTAAEIDTVHSVVSRYQLDHVVVQPIQSDVTRGDLTAIRGEVRDGMLQLISRAFAARDSSARVQDSLVRRAHPALDSLQMRAVAVELQRTFPEIVGVAWVPIANLVAPDSLQPPPALALTFAKSVSRRTRTEVVARAGRLVQARSGGAVIQVREQ